MRLRLAAITTVAAVAVFVVPATASASEIIDRNASKITLKVASNGQALVSYNARGKRWNVLAWGAVNAIEPTTTRKQVEFKLDYSGGYGTYKKDIWKTFKNACTAYDGPKLEWFVTGCKASDGSYWALQAWQRMLPNYGLVATPKQAVWELRLSHWSGPIAELTVNLNWAYRKYHHIFGSFTYLGKPVYGMKSTSTGVPLDTFGRNLYLDTFNSAYSKGWMRESSFLMHKNTGMFCYGFYRHGARPEGHGDRYRATIIGPGVTPDIFWSSEALQAYDKDFDLQMHAMQKEFLAGDALCRAVYEDPARRIVAVTSGEDLREVMRRYPTGVAVVTVDLEGEQLGLTVASLMSVALEPPLVGISIARQAALHELLRGAGGFAVSLLGANQLELAQHFARGVPPIAIWHGIDKRDSPRGPLLGGALGWLECVLAGENEAGDHTLFLGGVERVEQGEQGAPLIRLGGDYQAA